MILQTRSTVAESKPLESHRLSNRCFPTFHIYICILFLFVSFTSSRLRCILWSASCWALTPAHSDFTQSFYERAADLDVCVLTHSPSDTLRRLSGVQCTSESSFSLWAGTRLPGRGLPLEPVSERELHHHVYSKCHELEMIPDATTRLKPRLEQIKAEIDLVKMI